MSTPICLAVNSIFVSFQPNWQDTASDEDEFIILEISHTASRGAEQLCNDNVIPPLLDDGFSILGKIFFC